MNLLIGSLNHENKVSKSTASAAYLPPDFLVKYQLVSPPQSYFINSFITLGLEDPFPEDDLHIKGSVDDDSFKISTSPEDLIYERSRYHVDYSPLCIYLPREELMLKLMRACLDVKTPE
jgi:hypothetical protein